MNRVLPLAAVAAALAAAPAANAAPPRAQLQRAVDRVVATGAPGAIALVRDGDRTVRVAAGHATSPRGARCGRPTASASAARRRHS